MKRAGSLLVAALFTMSAMLAGVARGDAAMQLAQADELEQMEFGEPVGDPPIGGPAVEGEPVEEDEPIGGPPAIGEPVEEDEPIGGEMVY